MKVERDGGIMKVLVIGGNKFFGLELVNLLLDKKFDVHVANRGNHKPNYRGMITHHTCDRENIDELSKIANMSWDLVFDQVCMNEFHAKEAIRLFKDNCKKYIMTSSQSVYDAGSALKESDFEGENYHFSEKTMKQNEYAENKRRADSTFLQSSDLNTLIVRPPIVLGELDSTGRLAWHVNRIIKGQEINLPNLNAKISFVNADDLAKNIVLLGESNLTGAVNICSREPITLGDLITNIENVTNKKLKRAESKSDSNHSPYGIDDDWWMDSSKLESYGGSTRPIKVWLPDLIKNEMP